MILREIDELWIDQIEAELYVDYLCYAEDSQLSKEMLLRLKNPDYSEALYYLLLTVVPEGVDISEKIRRRMLLLLELIEIYFPQDVLFSDAIMTYWKEALFQKQGVKETKIEVREKLQFLSCINVKKLTSKREDMMRKGRENMLFSDFSAK